MPNYNNPYGGYPYGVPYQPYQYGSYPNFGQQASPQMNNQQQSQTNQYAFVNGIEGAKSYQLQPNQSILLMDSDGPLCYMKSANGMGQSTLRYFKLMEVSENDLRNNSQSRINSNDYVLRTDFEVLSKKVDSLLNKSEKPFKKENTKVE